MADKVVLLDFWASMYGMRVRIALSLKGIEFEFREQDLRNKSSDLLQMNPVHKKIPVLVHNGRPICESLIIVEYIDEVWRDTAPLLPSDPYQRAEARFWGDYVDHKVFVPARKLVWSRGEEQEAAKAELMECLKVLEGELGEKNFFGGEVMGYVDVALVTLSTRFRAFETYGGFRIGAEWPKLAAWVQRCLQNTAVARVLPDPDKAFGFVSGRRKMLLGE